MRQAREHIENGSFEEFRKRFVSITKRAMPILPSCSGVCAKRQIVEVGWHKRLYNANDKERLQPAVSRLRCALQFLVCFTRFWLRHKVRLHPVRAAASAFCAVHFPFHHHVFRDDPAAEKAAGTAKEIDRESKDRPTV